MKDMKDNIVKYLEGIRDYYGTYHNHKEASAWAGLAFYAVLCSIFTGIKYSGENEYMFDHGSTILILVVALLVFLYQKNQFKLKDVASSYVSAAMRLVIEVLLKDAKNINPSDYLQLDSNLEDKDFTSRHCLPKTFLQLAKKMEKKGSGAARKTRVLAYVILGVITVGTIGIQYQWKFLTFFQ